VVFVKGSSSKSPIHFIPCAGVATNC
jgi:hypothetical protein